MRKSTVRSTQHTCLDCGATNELFDSFREGVVCWKCAGRILRPEAGRTTYTPKIVVEDIPTERARMIGWMLAVFCCVTLSWIIVSTVEAIKSGNPVFFEATNKDVIFPGIHWNETDRPLTARISITTNRGLNYLIKLEDVDNAERSVGIYTKGGQDLEIFVPSGLYRAKVAAGKAWRGRDELFGGDGQTVIYVTNKLFDLRTDGRRMDMGSIDLTGEEPGSMSTDFLEVRDF